MFFRQFDDFIVYLQKCHVNVRCLHGVHHIKSALWEYRDIRRTRTLNKSQGSNADTLSSIRTTLMHF